MKIQKIKIIYKFKNKKAPRGAFYFVIFRAIRRLKINFAYFLWGCKPFKTYRWYQIWITLSENWLEKVSEFLTYLSCRGFTLKF